MIVSRPTILAFAAALLFANGCTSKRKSPETADESVTSAVNSSVAEIGSAVSVSEGAAAPGIAAVACPYSGARSSCSSGVVTLDWNGCQIGTNTLTGGWREIYKVSGTPDCAAEGALTTVGNSLTRTTIATKPEVVTTATGAKLFSDTAGGTAWDGTRFLTPSVMVTGGATRTIVNTGVHRVLRRSTGARVFDHYITFSIQATGASRATRQVSGTSVVYHNLAQYNAYHTFDGTTPAGTGVASAPLTYSIGCCYPTGGKIVTTFGDSSNTVMDFSPGATTCGEADFTNTNGVTATVTMGYCK